MAKFTDQFKNDYIVVDLETTGLSPEIETIIEIAAVKVIGGRVTDTFSSLVDPCRHISPQITDITGIDDSMVMGMPTISKVIPEFMKFAGDLPLMGHNFINFDLHFLRKQTPIISECVDTLKIARQMKFDGGGHSLSALCAYFGVVNDNAHRALFDCLATHEVYRKLMEKFRTDGAFISCSLACGRKLYQTNITEHCSIGMHLTARKDKNGRTELMAGEYPVGLVPSAREENISENRELISDIVVSDMSENSKGKLGVTAEFLLKE